MKNQFGDALKLLSNKRVSPQYEKTVKDHLSRVGHRLKFKKHELIAASSK